MNQESALIGDAAKSDEGKVASTREVVQQFVLFWGKMGPNWGINRTMAQIHALLYCSEDPMDTDTIMEELSISRGNASMNLRSLVEWNLLRKVHREGSRRNYYFAEKDVWFITAQIIKERQRREIQPVKEQLKRCISQLDELEQAENTPLEDSLPSRLNNLNILMEVIEGFSDAILPLIQQEDKNRLKAFMEMIRYLERQSEE